MTVEIILRRKIKYLVASNLDAFMLNGAKSLEFFF